MPQLTEEQRRAAESIDTNVLVSAGAGSGKTMVLVERYLEVLRRNTDAGITDIIAVTFTRKAAEEMRSRLKARLKEICNTADEGDERVRWNKLLAESDRARIGTIHSLCESLLKSFPAEAGVDPQFEIMDDLVRARILQECVEKSLQSLIAEGTSDVLALLEYPIESIRNWAISTMAQIPQFKEARELLGSDLELMEEHAKNVVGAVKAKLLRNLLKAGKLRVCLSYIVENPWPDPDNKLELIRAEIARYLYELYELPLDETEALNRGAELVFLIAGVPSPGTSGGPKGKPLRNVLAEIRTTCKDFAESCPIALNAADEGAFAVLRALIRLLDQAIGDYEQRKLELQKLDYNDLIVKTHALICKSGTSARKQFGDRLRALLVDEFQDTNQMQAQLLSSLCGEQARLFLIGDDKQSIYRFQGADVSTFNRWKSLIETGSHGLEGESQLLDLSFSFRSHPSIVDFVNRFFRFYFHDAENSAQEAHKAQHRALVPSRTDSHEPDRVELIVYDTSESEQKRSTEQAKGIEAQAVAAWVLEKVGSGCTIFDKSQGSNRPMRFGDFAVLVQANGDFASIEAALADAGIPYVTYAGSGFLNRQEILDIENMLRWLSCPEDDHALIGILRSPFFSFNDGLIHKVYTEGTGSLWSSLQKAAKSNAYGNLQGPIELMKRLLSLPDQKSLSELVRAVVSVTAYDIVCLALPNGKQKSRNIWKFIAFIRDHNHLSISAFLSALKAMRELGVSKQTDAPLSADNSVKLMTIHKSKGLEFPAVALPVLSRKVHLFTPKLLLHPDFSLAFDTSRSTDDEKPAYFRACLSISNEFDEEERKRLLYVAMTRARDYLGFFMERSARNEISFRLWIKNALGLDMEDADGTDSSRRAQIDTHQHCKIRYFDDLGISEWERDNRELAAPQLQSHDAESLAERMNFELVAPLDLGASGEVPASRIQWHRAERVTLSVRSPALHPTVVGNMFHATMQHILTTNTSANRDMIARLAIGSTIGVVERSLRKSLIDRVEKLISIYQISTLKQLIQTASRLMSEIDYTAISPQGDADKRPDLILQDGNGQWKIIDFKTDHVEPGGLAAKINEHSSQVLHYVHDFEAITNYKATGWLYFAETGQLEEVCSPSFAVGKKGQLRLF